MKQYKSYMDRVSVSQDLHRKLLDLEAPKRRPSWQKYGALAACLILLAGAGVYGVTLHRWRQLEDCFASSAETAPVVSAAIDLAPEDPDSVEPGMKTIPGFEVRETLAGVDVVRYYVLPWIDYGSPEIQQNTSLISMDYAAPEGSTTRDLTRKDVLALVGGEESMDVLLDWSGFTYGGMAVFTPDGKVWQMCLSGKRDDCFFELELAPDALPLTCVITPALGVTEVWGVEVTGRYAGIHGEGPDREVWMPESREVEFIARGVGCRFQFYGLEGESESVERMVSRFVRHAILEGLDLSALTPDGAVVSSPAVSVGEPNWNDSGASPSAPPQQAETGAYEPGN